MTNKEKIEQNERRITTNNKIIISLSHKFRTLEHEWGVYENKYKNYLAKKNRFRKLLWWMLCKMTFRSTKLTKKELTKCIAKQMARIFYKGGCK